MIESKLNGNSLDIVNENILKIKELFPEIVDEDKIDFDKLKLVLGENFDDSQERYNFTWPGKREALIESQKTSNGTLNPCKSESKNWDSTQNLYIEGDNLEVLKILQKSYYNKIKMIYIDPPYNTGNDFIYPDDYNDNLDNYLELTNQITGGGGQSKKLTNNPETNGRYHSNWLNMLYPRLRLAKNLLTENGVLFISIDDHEVDNLKKICDEIFGEENFVAQMVWEQGRKSMAQKIAINHEYCLIFCKNKKVNTDLQMNNDWKIKKDGLNEIYKEYDYLKKIYQNDYVSIEKGLQKFYNNLPNNHPSKKHKHFKCVDEKGIYNPDNISQGTGKGGRFDIIHPVSQKPCKLPAGGWRFSEGKLKELLKENKIHFGKDYKTVPCIKRYLKDTEYEVVSSVFYKDGRGASKNLDKLLGKSIFKFPKDVEIIEKFISFIFNENYGKNIILDFFSGSSTTAEATFKFNLENNQNLKFILVQLPEDCNKKSEAYKAGFKNICEIGKERIRRAGDNILEESNNKDLDVGFKVFKLDSSNLTKWNPDYDNLEDSLISSADNIVSGRSELDLVYEVMLKYGVDLSVPVEEIEIDGKKVFNVGFGALFVCLDNNLTVSISDELVDLIKDSDSSVTRVVFKDNGFASDSDKANVKETLRASNVDEFITI